MKPGYTTIRSPIKGVIIDRRVNVGQIVLRTDAASLFLIANLEKLQVWANVKEADIAKIHVGQRVRFDGRCLPRQGSGRRSEAGPPQRYDVQNAVAYTVVVAVLSTTEKLLPYMTANLEFDKPPNTGRGGTAQVAAWA